MPRHVVPSEVAGNLAYGLTKGYKTQSVEQKPRISRRKGRLSTKNKLIRGVIRDVAGFAPYEKRCVELLKVGKDKRALKFCKKKLGTHSRGKRKREEIADLVSQMAARAEEEKKAKKA